MGSFDSNIENFDLNFDFYTASLLKLTNDELITNYYKLNKKLDLQINSPTIAKMISTAYEAYSNEIERRYEQDILDDDYFINKMEELELLEEKEANIDGYEK